MTPANVALAEAAAFVRLLPPTTVWGILITNDTGDECPAALNVWVEDDAERVALRERLKLGKPVWASDDAEEYKYTDKITVAIILKKE